MPAFGVSPPEWKMSLPPHPAAGMGDVGLHSRYLSPEGVRMPPQSGDLLV